MAALLSSLLSTPLLPSYQNRLKPTPIRSSPATLLPLPPLRHSVLKDDEQRPPFNVDPDEILTSDLEFIGRGGFGEIYKAYWRGKQVAVKMIVSKWRDDPLVLSYFKREIEALSKLAHPNIIQFLGASLDKNSPMLIMEYLPLGDLGAYLKMSGPLSSFEMVTIAIDIARGMTCVHSKSIIHRDLNPRNVLIMDNNGDRVYKVADFGLSKTLTFVDGIDMSIMHYLTPKSGNLNYMAPEVFDEKKYNQLADVYSFGVLVNEMIEYAARSTQQQKMMERLNMAMNFKNVVDDEGIDIFKNVDRDLNECIKKCLARDPLERPSFAELVETLERVRDNIA